jgi:hypothetical protein
MLFMFIIKTIERPLGAEARQTVSQGSADGGGGGEFVIEL